MADGIDIADLQRQIMKTTKKLDKMESKIRKKVLRKSLGAAAGPYMKGLKANAPSDERDLRRTMGKQIRTERGELIAEVGQSKAKRRRRKAAQIHLVDQDTKPHSITGSFVGFDGELKTGTFQHPGTEGTEFVELTARQKRMEALRLFATKTAVEVEAEASRV